MILISAHKDTVMNHYRFSYEKGVYTGLLDNSIGVLVSNLLLYDDPNISLLEMKGDVKFYFGSSEEWGTITDTPKLSKDDIALVVDVASGNQYKNVDVSLENISGFKKEEVDDLKECLEWEGFKIKSKMFDGNPDDEDEGWHWKEKGIKVISFIIPIEAGNKNTGWHVDDCKVSYANVVKAKQILKRTINYLL